MVGGLIAAAALLRLVVAWLPGEWLLRHVLADDPFYYLTIARNLAGGHGLTFDQVEPTNGFHPLWLFAIAPIFGVFHGSWTAVHVVLTLAALIDVLALVLLVVLLFDLEVSRAVGVGTAALYAFSPLLLSLAGPLNGLETAIDAAGTFLFLICYRRAAEHPRGNSSFVGLSIAAAVLFLARTDSAVLLVFAFSFLFWRARADRRARVRLLVAAVAGVCLTAPWLAWSWSRFGSIVQVSGLAAAHVTRAMFEAQSGTWADYAGKFGRNLATLAAYVPVGVGVASTLARRASANMAFVAALLVSGALLARSVSGAERSAFRARLSVWWPLLLGACTFIFVHTVRAVELRSWYFSSLVPIVLVPLALVADFISRSLLSRPPTLRWLCGASTTVVFLAMLVHGWTIGLAPRCGELDAYRAIQLANRTLPQGTTLGAWNAGLFGYFYERGQVVNLDGLVNNAAYHHVVDRSLGAYVVERKIDYLIDSDGAIGFGQTYWNNGRRVSFPAFRPLVEALPGCRRIVLAPLAPANE